MVLGAKLLLILSSLFFYAWWNVWYLPILLGSILVNYTLAKSINNHDKSETARRKLLMIIGVVANVSLLAFFKHTDFLISNINLVFSSSVGFLNLALPLAISFFTFQQIAYLVDTYRGKVTNTGFLNYALFVTFFPQLIAGPIVHHCEMMPQFTAVRNLVKNYSNIATGLVIFSIGF